MLDWRVAVIDENRFCIVGTLDLTFRECSELSDGRRGGFIRLPERRLEAIGSFEVAPQNEMRIATVRGQHFYKRDGDGKEHQMLHVVVSSSQELDNLRRTGRFREWDADLREPNSTS